MSRPEGYVLGIDFGLKHIGIALGQTVTATASGLTTLPAKDGVPDWDRLGTIIAEHGPGRIVVGLPLNMDGSESDMSTRARAFGAALARRTEVPVEFVDERLTSRAAAQALRERGRKATTNHELAAALIVETWLNG